MDVGTNTVLFLALESGGSGMPRVCADEVAPTRLGAGLAAGEPSPAATARTLDAIGGFLKAARSLGITDVRVVGTEVLRRGAWRRDFLSAVRARFGLEVEVLAPEEEGRLVLLAARRSLPLGFKPVVAVDVGGGSAQIVRERGRGKAPSVASFPVGCVLLTEEFSLRPDNREDWERTYEYLTKELAAVEPAGGGAVMVAAGGTAATLAALEMKQAVCNPGRIHGQALTRDICMAWAERTHAMEMAARAELPGMPAGRADVFPAGALALAVIMDKLGCGRAVVSVQGVRFGVAYRYFDGEAGA